MSAITRKEFGEKFANGMDLTTPEAKSALGAADLNRDRVIDGKKELDRAFALIDGVDRDGSARTFDNSGRAGNLYGTALEGRRTSSWLAEKTAKAAADRVASDGPDYAYPRSPTSPLPGLSGNPAPGVSHPDWLRRQNKCNQFAGDALTQAGAKAPTVTMANGSLHYARAETWPAYTKHFDPVTSEADIRPGDVIMRDNTSATGLGTAHVEIVTGVNPMRTTGAHDNGAFETETNWLAGATYDPETKRWDRGQDAIHVLRPKKRLDD